MEQRRKHSTCRGRAPAFTLIELLVVISITMILSGLVIPALSRARDYARATKRAAHLHQLMIAMSSYAADHRQEMFWRGADTNGRLRTCR